MSSSYHLQIDGQIERVTNAFKSICAIFVVLSHMNGANGFHGLSIGTILPRNEPQALHLMKLCTEPPLPPSYIMCQDDQGASC